MGALLKGLRSFWARAMSTSSSRRSGSVRARGSSRDGGERHPARLPRHGPRRKRRRDRRGEEDPAGNCPRKGGRQLAEVTTLREAVAEMIEDGDSVALEGFTHLFPTAAAHESIRQERRNLTLIAASAKEVMMG